MKIKNPYFLFLVSLLLSSCSSPSFDYSRIKIVEVIDGDTLVLENEKRLRLIGIDTPEIRKKTSSGFIYQPAPFSLEAKEFAEDSDEAKYARIEFDVDKIDKTAKAATAIAERLAGIN